MAEKYRLNWERENQRLLDFYRDIRKDHGGEDSEIDNEEFQIIDNLEELDDQIIKRKREELEKMDEQQVEDEKANLLKREVKMENEMEFELKTLNLGEVNFGKNAKNLPFQDITGEPDFQVEDETKKKKKLPPTEKKKSLKANTKIAISSTLNLDSVKKEVEKQTHSRTMNMNWNKIELDEVKEEIKDEFQRDEELVDFNIDDDKIDRMDNDKD